MGLVAGVDTSTQSTKVEIRDADSGEVVGRGAAPHPVVTPPTSEQDPLSWWAAFAAAWEEAGSPDVDAISVGGQQHGMVALDADGHAVHPGKLWNDMESAADAAELVERLGDGDPATGAQNWAEAVGSVPVSAFTVRAVNRPRDCQLSASWLDQSNRGRSARSWPRRCSSQGMATRTNQS